jgi:mono/diheme cytochrome c family protein
MSDHDKKTTEEAPGETPVHGLLAEYESPKAIIAAANKVREAGFEKWDTYTPFPVHGIDRAMGIKMTALPWIVFAAAMTGLTTAVLLQWWTNAVDYPWIVSGKPFWSIPANVPIYFELTVLFSAFAALGGMLALNNLPLPAHPLDHVRRFDKATDDRFFLYIEAGDKKFDEDETRELLEKTHPAAIEVVHEDRETPNKMPAVIVYAMVILTVAAVVPFALAAKARHSKSTEPKIHAMGDMDWQARFNAQQPNPFYADEMAMRLPEPGTVAIGDLKDDDHFYQGKVAGTFVRTFPKQVEATDATMEHGRERFGIYCAPCHGLSGQGDGMVHKRAAALEEGTWVQPTSLTQENIYYQPVGQLFNTITHGIRNMPAYGSQIPEEDRWAIVMYVRALQRTKIATK